MASEHLLGVNVAPLATFSMTSEHADYPAINGNDKAPWNPMKATTTSTTITMIWGSSVTLQAFAIHMHNLVGATVTLTNIAFFNQVIAIPARTARGRCVDAWLDMRELANTASNQWNLTITGASGNVSIGEISAVATLSDAPFLVEGPVDFGEREIVEIIPTTYGVRHSFEYFVRVRSARGRLITEADRVIIYNLWKAVGGMNDPFLFIPNVDENDAWLAEFDSDTIQWSRTTPEASPITIGITELSGGLVP